MIIYQNGSNWVIEDQLDEKLVEKINNFIDENLNSLVTYREGHSTKGKNTEQYWLRGNNSYFKNVNFEDIENEQYCLKGNNFYFKNDNFEDIKNKLKPQILNRLKKSGILKEIIQAKTELKTTSCWSVVGEENSYHTAHSHPDNNNRNNNGISVIVYLKVPQTNVENEFENNLFLLMNANEENYLYVNKPPIIDINPVVGKVVIFPAHIIHGTYPQSKGIRQTFNINYRITEKIIKNINLNYG
jgi:hypothetical protein